MFRVRVIPTLLLKNDGLVKSKEFKNEKYVGDPINAVKIFNDKEVDELIFLDIMASRDNKSPDLVYIEDIASECFMPICYGGGITKIEEVRDILQAGVEKISLNSVIFKNPNFVKEVSNKFGSQSVVVSIDVKKNLFGKYSIYSDRGTKNMKLDPIMFAKELEMLGAGEILLNSIERDGHMAGYDLELIKKVSQEVNIPVIAGGGAGRLEHLKNAISTGKASAVAAGSLFVFHGPHRAVLINYPTQKDLEEEVYLKI